MPLQASRCQEMLGRIQAPITLVYGDMSPRQRTEDSPLQQMLPPSTRQVILPGRHNLHIDAPNALAAIMTEGPRWNTHAIIAGVGPLQVQYSIGLHVAAAERSAASWTVVIYTFPDQRTVANVGSLGSPFAAAWHELRLEPGRYSLALRYYHWSSNVELPAVTVDGVEVVQAKTVSPDINHFYDNLSQRKSIIYLCLHYYVFTMLRLSAWLPQALVEKNILPMGNPETRFYYGTLWRDESLFLEMDRSLLATRHVFLTLYTRDNFPLRWYEIYEARHTTAPSQANVFYLVRVHQKASVPESFADSWIRISVV